MTRIFMLIALLLAALSAPLAAQDLPARPDGPILDAPDLIPAAEEAALDQKLRAYTQQTGRVIVVAVVESIGTEPVDIYARNLAEQWGIGGAETEEGVLLLIAPNQRQMWISTARGVQDRLTDISSGRIYRDTLRPAFRAGDFAGGISRATDQIIERLNLSPADVRAIDEATQAAEQSRTRNDGGFPVGTLIWLGFMFFFFVLPLIRGRSRRRKYRAKGKGPWGKRRDDDDDDDDDGWGRTARDIILWEVGTAIARGALGGGRGGGSDWGGGGGGGFGGFGGGGGGFNGGGAGGGW